MSSERVVQFGFWRHVGTANRRAALASVAEVDLLVSWNFKHIVRFDKIRQFNAVNCEAGYKEIEIYSPREVTRYEQR